MLMWAAKQYGKVIAGKEEEKFALSIKGHTLSISRKSNYELYGVSDLDFAEAIQLVIYMCSWHRNMQRYRAARRIFQWQAAAKKVLTQGGDLGNEVADTVMASPWSITRQALRLGLFAKNPEMPLFAGMSNTTAQSLPRDVQPLLQANEYAMLMNSTLLHHTGAEAEAHADATTELPAEALKDVRPFFLPSPQDGNNSTDAGFEDQFRLLGPLGEFAELERTICQKFQRYDLDGSGTLNSSEEWQQLVTNLIYTFSTPNKWTDPHDLPALKSRAQAALRNGPELNDENAMSLEGFSSWFIEDILYRSSSS